ncbi:hypothetical protein MTP99_001646 [Tenebrio molitor]|jgi:SAGA-associated factor 11|uniref:SAGA-associated factor 11 homolog n=1 Tax=Tenebrio molitor TaxID=7067 RepID=A0A8J6LIN4_TENMO|nr:hypothetical protein GEV33_002584 [Tenebrio molitor]KAJ3638249.1 hypothetical protein MTP99_001646 [Tenebrio molitor]
MSKSQKLDDKQILSKLAKDFHELVTNKEVLRTSVESFLNNVIDELTLGIIFDLHRKYKTNSYEIEMEEDDADDDESNDVDIFAQHDVKKTQDCVCPNCDRAVAATRFAPHLEACMGMGRNRFRNATRRVASSSSKERENTTFSGVPSDDEDDMDWNSGNKRGKKKKRNGNKKSKSGGTPKKSGEVKPVDTSNVEIEAEDDDLSSLRDLLQDHSNSSSPADSVSSSHSNSSKKKDKLKNKKNKRDRSSPSSSISAE